MIINLEYIYYIAGIFLSIIAFLSFKDKSNSKRLLTGTFWGLFAISFIFGKVIPPMYMGVLVIIIALIAGFGGVRMGSYHQTTEEERKASAKKIGNKLFIPALLIPLVTIIGTVVIKDMKIGNLFLLDNKNVTLVSLGVACVVSLIVAMMLTKEKGIQPVKESRRLLDAIGWAAVLPQMLATLGGLFAVAGVGKVVSDLISSAIPVDNRFFVVLAYVLGMAIFTMIMGNAFAAFPVITAGIGLPLLVHMHGADPAIMGAIGMFSGYCGTLLTPMAANFNIVPTALLDLSDKYAVIKAQAPTAIILLTVNIFLMYFLVF
ncbi:DUF979 domain-containing protein [Bacillus sp. AFS041924]|uniref:DUF979 domain-containing protein n=1 Tax=Bacillus sp. AFS041924 TaxID=2033503 RepID=UPI000BFC0980|nr:DUF979 domain-containing protein [Bacillus sp. AFS041924]PGS51133.1 permease [Bacillus sp. AFS041924]